VCGPHPAVQIKYRYTRSYRDRHGKLRIEYRRHGRTIALKAEPGTAEFQAEYDAAKALSDTDPSRRPAQHQPEPIKPGTLRWLCTEYYRSAEWSQLAPITQYERKLILEHMMLEPIKPGSPLRFADCPLPALRSEHVKVLRDRKAAVPTAANKRVKYLGYLLKWAIQNNKGQLSFNPARDVAKLRIDGDGHHCWTQQECEQFELRHPVGSKARLAYALLLYTGQRRSDVVLLGRQNIRNGKLCFTQQKNKRRKPVALELPILPQLQQVMNASMLGDLTFLVTEYGRPYSRAGFGNWFRDRCNEAGLAHCSAHGLRRAAATVAAESGASPHELMSIFGWLTLSEAERYTRAAERRKLAERAMARLVPIKPGT